MEAVSKGIGFFRKYCEDAQPQRPVSAYEPLQDLHFFVRRKRAAERDREKRWMRGIRPMTGSTPN